MLLPKWARWAGLGLCAAMLPAMAVAARPTSHKSSKTNTTSHHAAVTKASKTSKKSSAKKLHTSSKKAHTRKLSATHKSKKSHKAQTRHTNKNAGASKLSKKSKR
jgi:hypothetical protein